MEKKASQLTQRALSENEGGKLIQQGWGAAEEGGTRLLRKPDDGRGGFC